MQTQALKIYHDGSCPLCRREIGHYRRQVGAERLEFVDVSHSSADPGPGVTRQQTMRYFHVRLPSGELRSGAEALIEIWKVLPKWQPAARISRVRGVTTLLNVGYRLSLTVRPMLAKAIALFC